MCADSSAGGQPRHRPFPPLRGGPGATLRSWWWGGDRGPGRGRRETRQGQGVREVRGLNSGSHCPCRSQFAAGSLALAAMPGTFRHRPAEQINSSPRSAREPVSTDVNTLDKVCSESKHGPRLHPRWLTSQNATWMPQQRAPGLKSQGQCVPGPQTSSAT